MAEIVSPGIQIPTFDAKARGSVTANALCKLRRRALDAAMLTEDGRAVILSYLNGRTYDSHCRCTDRQKSLFLHVAATKKLQNAAALRSGRHPSQDNGTLQSPSSWNEEARRIYDRK